METESQLRLPAAPLALAAALTLTALGVVGTGGDPDLMALRVLPIILIGAVAAHFLTRRKPAAYRWGVRLAFAAAFFLFWLIGGVGLLGPDDRHPADLMYIGVVAIGVAGAIIARFKAAGMSRAMFAAAGAHVVVGLVALFGGFYGGPTGTREVLQILGLSGMFAVPFGVSALLFASAAGQERRAAAAK